MIKLFVPILLSLMLLFTAPVFGAIDSEAIGPIYGDAAGIARVEELETQLHAMTIKATHPRVILTPEMISLAKSRVAAGHASWAAARASADTGNLINAAFAYLMLVDSEPAAASAYANSVYTGIMAATATTWVTFTHETSGTRARAIGIWALAFDWAYNGLSESQRTDLISKIGASANIAGRAAWIRTGVNDIKESFHREEWIARPWQAWPEVALAGHFTDADFCFERRWDYDWYTGDAIRWYAYINDGTPPEGYAYGADGLSWLHVLRGATGIDMIDDPQYPYIKGVADYQLYSTDFGLNRNIFHRGVGAGAGGIWTYTDTMGNKTNGKLQAYHLMAAQIAAPTNPYQQWFIKNPLANGWSGQETWGLCNEYYSFLSDLTSIAQILYSEPSLPSADPRLATNDQLPLGKLFPGSNEVFMRSSWGNNAAIASFRSPPTFTKSSHGDYDTNTFVLYRRGNLAMDSGVYDNVDGQINYFWYQKNTTAHNDLLIINPASPNAPTKLSAAPDPGGIDAVSTQNFGGKAATADLTSVFLHRSNANHSDITVFETNENYDYSVGVTTAYGSRATETDRSFVFLRRPNDKAYAVVYDRVNATSAAYVKKWLLHTVEEPTVDGAIISTEVDNHIYTLDGSKYSAVNAYNNSALYGKVLLPEAHTIRKLGGTDHQFWIDGTTPKNISIDWTTIAASKEPSMGGPLKEIGQWRLEVIPTTQQQRDLFLNVIYLGDTGETPADSVLATCTDATRAVVFVPDATKNEIVVLNKSPIGTRSSSFSYTYTPTAGQTEHILTELPPGSGTVVTVVKNGSALPASPITASTNGTVTFTTDDTIGQSITIAVSTTGDVEECSPDNLLLCLDSVTCDVAGGFWWPIAGKCDSYAEPVASQGATIRGVDGEIRKVNGDLLGVK